MLRLAREAVQHLVALVDLTLEQLDTLPGAAMVRRRMERLNAIEGADPGDVEESPFMDAPVTPQATRRALARAERGATLDVAEAAVLLAARGDDLEALCRTAARVRDAGLEAAGRPGVVTYSPKVFIPLTRLCRDRCHYCTFVTTPNKLAAAGQSPYLSPDEVVEIARQGAALGCKEALFTLGDRPEDRWPAAARWLDEHGYDSTLDYLRAMAVRVLEETGLLPHLNPGVLSWEEIGRLKPVAPSLGMMLETTSTRLFTEKGLAHHGSPDKDPAVRLRVLEDAGRLNVPFTTGILVGIGENLTERAESVFAIRKVARQYGAVQEVIVQNFRAKPDTAMRTSADLGLEEYLATIAVARIVLGPRMRVQAPPNLVDLAECTALLGAGVDDWGGVSPLTPDHVNPERPWPSLERLRSVTEAAGFSLAERLTVHPEYVRAGEPWLDPRVSGHVAALATGDGLARPGARPTGLPWQEPDGGFALTTSTGRTDLHESIDTDGRTSDRRDDFDSVYGDWALLREQVAGRSTAEDGRSPEGAAAVAGRGDGEEPGGGGRGGRARRRRGPGRGRAWQPSEERARPGARARFGAQLGRRLRTGRRHPGRTGGRRERPAGPHRRPGAHPDDRRRRGPPRGGPDRRRPAPRRGR